MDSDHLLRIQSLYRDTSSARSRERRRLKRLEANTYITLGLFIIVVYLLAAVYAVSELLTSVSILQFFFWFAMMPLMASQAHHGSRLFKEGLSGLRDEPHN